MGNYAFPLEPIWPITSRFGEDFGRGPHRGVDFGCPLDTPIMACIGGEVVAFTNDGSFGVGVCIANGGRFALVAHLSRADVQPGQSVIRGQLIGASGNTGLSTGPHCHWQVADSPSFPTDIAHSVDPILLLGVDEMTDDEFSMRYARLREKDLADETILDAAIIPALVAEIIGAALDTYSEPFLSTNRMIRAFLGKAEFAV